MADAPAGPAGTVPAMVSPTEKPVRIQREVAHRLFALEFNASRMEMKGQGEKDPSYLVSPLGAKVNRLHVVGVCTDVEPVGESGEVWRARVSDPSGIFTVYAGNYQPEAAQALSQLQPPCFVAVTGKARTYEPEPGSVFVSIRPESVTVVDEATRDQWMVDTGRRTLERLKATKAATVPGATAESLMAQNVPKPAAEGAMLAKGHYGAIDLERYQHAAKQCLTPLVSGTPMPVQRAAPAAGPASHQAAPAPPGDPVAPLAPTWRAPAAPAQPDPAAQAAQQALDDAVLAAVQRLEGQKGARWDDVLSASVTATANAEAIEEALNRLMDKGLVYEPTLGVLKTT